MSQSSVGPPLSSHSSRTQRPTNGAANGYHSSASASASPSASASGPSLTLQLPSSSSSAGPWPSASPSLALSPLPFSPLPGRVRLSYAAGHVLNDLVASCWFSYLLVFLRTVLLFPATQAGLLLLIGQISDGLATPLVGLLSDRTDVRFGKRRAWIAVGSLVVALSFPPIFHAPFLTSLSSSPSPLPRLPLLVAYYAAFIVVFQWAWASVQVSHLALVPELSRDSNERVYLNSLRSIATILSNVAVFCLAFAILHSRSCNSAAAIGPADVASFWTLAVAVVAVGAVFSLCFVCGVPEPLPRKRREGQSVREWYHWFGELGFYQTMVVYTCTRLMVNVTQTYMPLYLLVTLGAPKSSIASVPLVCFAAGLMSTCVCERLTRRWGSAGLTFVGCLTVLLSCWGVWLVGSGNWLWSYAVAFVLGSGTGIVGVSALSLICELVGDCCESGAFVYGSMSFSDKIANGVAIMATEMLTPTTDRCDEAGTGDCMRVTEQQQVYYRWVMLLAPGGSAIVAMLMLSFIILTRRMRHTTPHTSAAPSAPSSHSTSLTATPLLAVSSSSSPAAAAAAATASTGPCSAFDWNNTTASALQGVRGVNVGSPMHAAVVYVPGDGDGDGDGLNEQTPLLSHSYRG